MSDQPKPDETPPAGPREKLTAEGWRERASGFELPDGGRPSEHHIAGALHDAEPDQLFTQAAVQQALNKFAKNEIEADDAGSSA